jgi:hypothetical protein
MSCLLTIAVRSEYLKKNNKNYETLNIRSVGLYKYIQLSLGIKEMFCS